MSTETNVQTVQAVFAAFGAGDIPAILQLLTPDVSWAMPGPATIPYAGVRRGPGGAREFFEQLGGAAEFEQFEIQDLVASGDKVVALGHERYRVRATGGIVDQDFALLFVLRDGKICRFLSFEDTHAINAAFTAG